jgi:hypothetical protein
MSKFFKPRLEFIGKFEQIEIPDFADFDSRFYPE